MTGFLIDPRFAVEIARLDATRDLLQHKADDAAKVASELAPDDPRTSGNDLHSQIVGEVEMTGEGWRGRVHAYNWKAGWFEFGTVRQPPRPFIKPAVEQVVGPIEGGR